jgi:hypothetical protein
MSQIQSIATSILFSFQLPVCVINFLMSVVCRHGGEVIP